jgi:hypothetical protein
MADNPRSVSSQDCSSSPSPVIFQAPVIEKLTKQGSNSKEESGTAAVNC